METIIEGASQGLVAPEVRRDTDSTVDQPKKKKKTEEEVKEIPKETQKNCSTTKKRDEEEEDVNTPISKIIPKKKRFPRQRKAPAHLEEQV